MAETKAPNTTDATQPVTDDGIRRVLMFDTTMVGQDSGPPA